MSIPASQQHLFKLDWVGNPALLAEQQQVTGIRSQYTAEIAAWCVELHQQLQELARDMSLRSVSTTIASQPSPGRSTTSTCCSPRCCNRPTGTLSAPTHPTGTPRRSSTGACRPPRTSLGPPRWRLQEWSACIDRNTRFWHHINAMQSSQLARGSQRTPEEWTARCHRLIVATRCLQDAKPHEFWQRAISIEARIPAKPQGPELRALRRAVRRIAKAPIGHPRAGFWAALAQAEDSTALSAGLDAFDRALADI